MSSENIAGKSKVFFTDMRCRLGTSLLDKLSRLVKEAGIETIDFTRKYTAIKIHFGEPGNLAFLRPAFSRVIVDIVKSRGGYPFLTDCNTLYVGRRNNALVHLDAAFENGYTPFSTACQNIIADGLKGTDDVEVAVPGGVYCKTARIGRAIMDADIVLSLNHFKGHEGTGFGGALKNLGMGSGSRAGKMLMHNDGKPNINEKNCKGCGLCAKNCQQNAISFVETPAGRRARIDKNLCAGCGRCIGVCAWHAVENSSGNSAEMLCAKIAEYALAVVHGRPNFHVNIVNNVTPYCDCHGESDANVVPDIGIFASFDPVALDAACIDAVNGAPELTASSILSEREHIREHDPLTCIHPTTNWRAQLAHAEKIGLGTRNYNLITL